MQTHGNTFVVCEKMYMKKSREHQLERKGPGSLMSHHLNHYHKLILCCCSPLKNSLNPIFILISGASVIREQKKKMNIFEKVIG